MLSLLSGFYDAYFASEVPETVAGAIAPNMARMGGAAPVGQVNEIWQSGRVIGNVEAMGPAVEMEPLAAGADVPELEAPLLGDVGPEAPAVFMNEENDLLGELEEILGEPLVAPEELEGELYDAFERFVEEPMDDGAFFGDAWGEVEAEAEELTETSVILDGFGEVIEPLNDFRTCNIRHDRRAYRCRRSGIGRI